MQALTIRRVFPLLVAVGAGCLVVAAGGCGPSPATPSASSSACGDYFDAIYSSGCQPNFPALELARDRGRFLTLCDAELALPGVGVSSAQLESCAKALASAGICIGGTSSLPSECQNFDSGTQASGAACFTGSQCESGNCNTSPPDGGAATSACGFCTIPLAVGQSCGMTSNANCGMGSVCSGTTATCQVVVYGDVGATCGTDAALCSDGLYCDLTTMQCASAKPAGSACTMTAGECASPLVCLATTNACGSPGRSGAPCMSTEDCAPGFDCATMNQCVAITYAAAGQPCGGAVQCLVGSCTGDGSSDVCPTVIPDGQPCAAQVLVSVGPDASASALAATPTTCDVFADCENGVCTLVPPTCQ